MRTTTFDVLIVYSENLADSAASASSLVVAPFSSRPKHALYNEVYSYFMDTCQTHKLTVAFTTSADIVGAGLCRSYWLNSKNIWIKVKQQGYAELIFDKVSPKSKKLTQSRKLLFSSEAVKPFNNPYIHSLFFDKQKTYAKLKSLAIPTVMIADHTARGVRDAYSSLRSILKTHPNQQDFSSDIIMKDRFGAGGYNVHKFGKDQLNCIPSVLKQNTAKSFILQPFTKFDKGYKYNQILVSADIRLIYLKGNIVQAYVRMAQRGSFLCNEHQGGLLKYISRGDVPRKVMILAKKILKTLNANSSLFALDFLVSNHGNAYLVEGNTGPGLDWNPLIQINIDKSKEFIKIIVHELARLVRMPKVAAGQHWLSARN